MREFKVGDHSYRTSGRLNAFAQFHVSRRMGPILAVMGTELLALARAPADGEQRVLGRFADLFPVVADVLSKMSDDDCNYVLHACLGVVQRQVSEGQWQAVIAKGGHFMYDDIDMDTMLRLVVPVLQENMAGFLKGLGGSTPSPSS